MRPLDDIDRVLAQLAARSHALHAARRSLAEVDGDRAHLESELERLSTASPVDAGDDAITRSLARLRALQTQREQIGATIAELSRADHELDSALVQKADAIRALARPDAGRSRAWSSS